ncbi:hypothetical protein [uncultured Zoogloea sp.]|uniref:hypothetical protein n=1 Tax=uncultured Zoogloea sp. TaxID=160237 RepID=UPI002638F918|nr:hypothetical protein [uncultured Zoogloea sp.]
MRDLYSNLGVVSAVVPQVLAATDTSAAIDLRGFDSMVGLVNTGAIGGAGDYTLKLQHSDTTTSGDFVDVTSSNGLIGTLPASLAASTAYKFGYSGGKRYVRTVTTKNGGTSIAVSVQIAKGKASQRPVA